ncbi:DDE-type integrase/transposase/recombinase [Paraburkholderia aspalathi]|uniref:DDE-type integrase/transposase/recombinase n=1 Tax=Paraburkholderia aspalathi TaxID=1324617 RepID=UPI0038BBE702
MKIRGKWAHLCRVVDRVNQTVDFMLKAERDAITAKAFVSKVTRHQSQPSEAITLDDGYAASRRAVPETKDDGLLPEETNVRISEYRNNLIDHDHLASSPRRT